jgi:hypothetical protein
MKKILSLTFLAALLGAAGCSSSNPPPPIPDNPTTPPETAQLQVIHAVADAPSVTVNVGGPPPAGSALDGLEFRSAASGEFTPGTFAVTVDANPAGADPILGIIDAGDVEFVANTRTIIIATGVVGAIEPVVLTQDVGGAASTGQSTVRIVHAAPDAGLVDIYATAPDGELVDPVTLDYQGESGVLTLSPGDYQIRVTPNGVPGTILFDSGTTTLLGGEDIIALAITNTTASPSPITLLVADSTTGDVAEVQDTAVPAGDLQIVHASPDAGLVDVLADGAVLVDSADYAAVADFPDLAAGTYDIEIRPEDGDETTNVFQGDVTLDAGVTAKAIAIGLVAATGEDDDERPVFDLGIYADDHRRVSTDAKIRAIHAAASIGDIDLYVVETGTDITTVDPTISGGFGANTGFLSLAPGNYDLVVTTTETVDEVEVVTEVSRIDNVPLDAAGIYTAVAIDDPDNVGLLTTLSLDDPLLP